MEDVSESGFDPTSPPGEKLYDPSKVRLARLSWLIPVAGAGITLFVNAVRMQQPANPVARWIGVAGFVLFVAGVAVGFVLAVVSLALSVKYRGVLGHAIGGLVASVAFALLIVAMFWAIATLRAIQERRQQGRPGGECPWPMTRVIPMTRVTRATVAT
jgi:hypothetical protein